MARQAINLLPEGAQHKERVRRLNFLATLVAVLVGGGLFLGLVGVVGFRAIQENEKKKVLERIDAIAADIETNGEFFVEFEDPTSGESRRMHIEEVGEIFKSRLSLLESLSVSRRSFATFLSHVTFVIPSGVRLTALHVTADGGIRLSGSAKSYETIASFIYGLEHYPGDPVLAGIESGLVERPVFNESTKKWEVYTVGADSAQKNKPIGVGVNKIEALRAAREYFRALPAAERLAFFKTMLETRSVSPAFTAVKLSSLSHDASRDRALFDLEMSAHEGVFRET